MSEPRMLNHPTGDLNSSVVDDYHSRQETAFTANRDSAVSTVAVVGDDDRAYRQPRILFNAVGPPRCSRGEAPAQLMSATKPV